MEVLRVFNVGDLIPIIKTQLKIKGDIAIHSGSYSLEESKLVTELFNTEDDAYEITVEGNGMHKIFVLKNLKPSY